MYLHNFQTWSKYRFTEFYLVPVCVDDDVARRCHRVGADVIADREAQLRGQSPSLLYLTSLACFHILPQNMVPSQEWRCASFTMPPSERLSRFSRFRFLRPPFYSVASSTSTTYITTPSLSPLVSTDLTEIQQDQNEPIVRICVGGGRLASIH